MSRSLQDAVTSGNVAEVEVRLNMGEDVRGCFPPRFVLRTLLISQLWTQLPDLSPRGRLGRQPGHPRAAAEERGRREPGGQGGRDAAGLGNQVRDSLH